MLIDDYAAEGKSLARQEGKVIFVEQVVPGDVVTVREPGWERRYEVTQTISKRVGAPIARTCYVDQSPPKPEYLMAGPVARRDRGAGRPTKRDRREIEKLIGRHPITFEDE